MTDTTGGAAFPSPGVVIPGTGSNSRHQGAYEGMTLRDYFAAKAMAAIILNEVDCTFDALAGRAYLVADAMLQARSS